MVASECGHIYNIIDGEYSIFYDTGDENEYFGKITRYNDHLWVIGGHRCMSILMTEDGTNYNLCKIDLGLTNHNETVRFIDDFLVLASSSYNSIMFFPIEEIYSNLLVDNFSLCKFFTLQLVPYSQFRFNSIDFINGKFILGGNFYGGSLWDSGMVVIEKDFSSFLIQEYGWKATKLSVIDGKIYILCNYIYGTDKKACLVVDGKIVIVFHESYELNDFSVTDEYIYIVGRYIIPQDGTTINRGVILILDREYELNDIYSIRGSGSLLGCISMGKDYANDLALFNCTDFIRSQMKDNKFYMSVGMEGWKQ